MVKPIIEYRCNHKSEALKKVIHLCIIIQNCDSFINSNNSINWEHWNINWALSTGSKLLNARKVMEITVYALSNQSQLS